MHAILSLFRVEPQKERIGWRRRHRSAQATCPAGKTSQPTSLGIRGQARDGTTQFYRVITAYLMLIRLWVTLVVRFVLPDEDTVQGWKMR